jgi:hypothetical protein
MGKAKLRDGLLTARYCLFEMAPKSGECFPMVVNKKGFTGLGGDSILSTGVKCTATTFVLEDLFWVAISRIATQT